MSMQVKKKCDLVFFINLSNQIINSLDLGKILYIFVVKIAIKILTKDSSSVVADEDPVRINHRYDEEYIVVCQLRSF